MGFVLNNDSCSGTAYTNDQEKEQLLSKNHRKQNSHSGTKDKTITLP